MALDEKIIAHTENPVRELLAVSSRTGINVNELDFELLAFSTQYKLQNQDWTKISEKELSIFENNEMFLKEDLQIKQEYKIEIFHNQNEDELFKAVHLVANKNITKIVAKIDFSVLKFDEKLALKLLQNIYKKMLKLNFLIGIRIFDFKKELLKICNEHKNSPFQKIVQIIVASGVEPIQSKDDSLELCYKKKAENFSIDEKRSNIISVDEGEVVLRHIKPKQGKEGKNLNLHNLKVLVPNENRTKFSCSSAFKEVAQDESVDYIALKKGFVVENELSFDIRNELEFGEVDFKNTGAIRAGLDKNVKINIKFPSDLKDAVNSGVSIECEELNIVGGVANNTKLEAKKLSIEGTTNSKAKIKAKEAYIKTHRGFAEAEILKIDLLEGGFVKANEVRIKKSLGGSIEANKIYIQDLESNNTCIFYENSVVENINGTNNKFNAKIKALEKNLEEEFSKILLEISELNFSINKLKQSILLNKNAILKFEKKSSGLNENPPQYNKILKELSMQNARLLKLQEQNKILLEKKTSLESEILKAEEELLGANFINKSGKWSNLNEVKFSLLKPKKELFYSSNSNDNIKFIGLKKSTYENEEIVDLDKRKDYEAKDVSWL